MVNLKRVFNMAGAYSPVSGPQKRIFKKKSMKLIAYTVTKGLTQAVRVRGAVKVHDKLHHVTGKTAAPLVIIHYIQKYIGPSQRKHVHEPAELPGAKALAAPARVSTLWIFSQVSSLSGR